MVEYTAKSAEDVRIEPIVDVLATGGRRNVGGQPALDEMLEPVDYKPVETASVIAVNREYDSVTERYVFEAGGD